jgi:cardiolipin synthase
MGFVQEPRFEESGTSDARALAGDGRFFEVDSNRVRLLRDGREAYPAMLTAIAAARREVLLEMYWFQGDRAGLMFRDALLAKAREGVDVRVSYDAVGSIGAPWSMWEPLIAAGGQVFEFGPVSPLQKRFRLKRINFRDHRKVLVVDAETAFTGGMNIGDPWLTREQGGEDWRDDAIEVRGPLAKDLRSLFFETWRRTGRGVPPDAERLSRKWSGNIAVLANHRGRARGIRLFYLRAIRAAKRRIDITNPYFLPGPIVLSALYSAQRRGVEVRILIPGQNDVWVVSMAMSSLMGRLLEAKARVFTYQGRILHAKTAVFDDELATTGTYNLDARSRRYNRECNIALRDKNAAGSFRDSFEKDLADSEELSLSAWKARPLGHRFFAWFAYPLRQFL